MNSTTICRYLRTKKMYIGSLAHEAFADKEGENASQCHFWCNLTQSVAGADDHPAHKNTCNPSRSCFKE